MAWSWNRKGGRLTRQALNTIEKATTPDSSSYSITNTVPNLPQNEPILKLPVEIIQQITAFLDDQSAASFCLSTRYICYAVGTQHLATYLGSGRTMFEKRRNIEILERAFPSHWYCAWCDRFHKHDRDGGPKHFDQETQRDCAEYNSYLYDGHDYVLTYHHVRLAMNRHLWGSAYGIGLEDFAYFKEGLSRICGKKMPTNLKVEAKIVDGHFLLHSAFTMVAYGRTGKRLPLFDNRCTFEIPQIVSGHRDSQDGHTCLVSTIQKILSTDWSQLQENGAFRNDTQLCSFCATDCLITPRLIDSGSSNGAPRLEIKIETWRDLYEGRNPFQSSWRAHGEMGHSSPGYPDDVLRLTYLTPRHIRQSFEKGVRLTRTDIPGTSEFKPTHTREPAGIDWSCAFAESWTQQILRTSRRAWLSGDREYDRQERSIREEKDHDRRVRENNKRLKKAGPSCTPPYGMSWKAFVDAGGMRGRDGIPLSERERRELTSGRGLFGG